MTACGIDAAGLLRLPGDAGSADARGMFGFLGSGEGGEDATAATGGGAAPEAGEDAVRSTTDDAGGGSQSAPGDASIDARSIADAGPADVSVADRIDVEASTPCGELLQCCGHLVVAPPIAAACYLSAQPDASATCGSTLSSFRDAGLCP